MKKLRKKGEVSNYFCVMFLYCLPDALCPVLGNVVQRQGPTAERTWTQ